MTGRRSDKGRVLLRTRRRRRRRRRALSGGTGDVRRELSRNAHDHLVLAVRDVKFVGVEDIFFLIEPTGALQMI